LKNEFEKSLKKSLSPSPLSLFLQPAQFPSPPPLHSPRTFRPSAFFLPRAQAGPSWPSSASPPAQRTPSPFLLFHSLTGGGRRSGSSPTSDRGSAPPPPSSRPPLPAASPSPLAFNRRNQPRNEALPSFPLFNRPLPSLIPPLIPHQGPRPLMAMPARKSLPLLTRAYTSTPRAPPHAPSHTPKLSRLPVPSSPLPPSWSAGRRTIAAARAPSSSMKLPNLSPSLLLRA
jgi:hypothetical protein